MCTNNLYFQGSQKNAKSNSKQHPVNKNEKKKTIIPIIYLIGLKLST